MTDRQPGSGLVNTTTEIIEDMLAAALCGDEGTVLRCEKRLLLEVASGRCGMSPDTVVRLIRDVAASLGAPFEDAVPRPLDRLGDIRARRPDGTSIWIELKAQTMKDRFAQITEADWVRDDTDFLRWMRHNDKDFRRRLPSSIADLLDVDDPTSYFKNWDRDSLWMADMALVSSRVVREGSGIKSPKDLRSFMSKKYIVHLTRQGVARIALTEVTPIAGVLRGDAVNFDFIDSNQTAVSVALASGVTPGRGRTQFTYHVGYPSGVFGRHKMHAVSLLGASDRHEFH